MLQAVADEAGHVLPHMDGLFADRGQQFHHGRDRRGCRVLHLDHLDQRHEIGRHPPVRAEDTVAVRHAGSDLADRDDAGVAGEERPARRQAVELGEDRLFQRQLLRRRLDDHVGIGDGVGQTRRRANTADRVFVLAEVDEILGDAGLQRGERLGEMGRGRRRSCPATAKTCAMPWPIRPAPTIAMFAFAAMLRRLRSDLFRRRSLRGRPDKREEAGNTNVSSPRKRGPSRRRGRRTKPNGVAWRSPRPRLTPEVAVCWVPACAGMTEGGSRRLSAKSVQFPHLRHPAV